jgi:hypothetical protein
LRIRKKIEYPAAEVTRFGDYAPSELPEKSSCGKFEVELAHNLVFRELSAGRCTLLEPCVIERDKPMQHHALFDDLRFKQSNRNRHSHSIKKMANKANPVYRFSVARHNFCLLLF